jgi:hypothetical protein
VKTIGNANPDGDVEALNETYQDIDRIISDLVECYALPHTKMCMRWSKPTVEEYREEVVGWLEDYSKSFRRLPEKSLPGRAALPGYARKRLDEEVARIVGGRNDAVESSYKHLFG